MYSYHSGLNKSFIAHDIPGLHMIMKAPHTTKLSNTMLNNNSVAGIMESVSINRDGISYSVSLQMLSAKKIKIKISLTA